MREETRTPHERGGQSADGKSDIAARSTAGNIPHMYLKMGSQCTPRHDDGGTTQKKKVCPGSTELER